MSPPDDDPTDLEADADVMPVEDDDWWAEDEEPDPEPGDFGLDDFDEERDQACSSPPIKSKRCERCSPPAS